MLLTITVVVVLSMSLLMKFGFNQGFTQYKKSLEKELNSRMIKSLETYYYVEKSWQGFSEDPGVWHELVFNSATDTMMKNKPERPSLTNRKEKNKSQRGSVKKPRPNSHQESERIHDINSRLRRVLPSYTLYNQQQEKVIGPVSWKNPGTHKIEIKYENQIVGYLLYEKTLKATQMQDKQFNRTIWVVLLMITAVMALIVLVFTLPITNYLIQPIKSLNQATKNAAAGDYTARTSIHRNDELGQLGQNFNVLTDTLRLNAEVHKKMMADISHELRTPVAVLLAEIEAIQDGIHAADTKNLSLLHRQTSALKHLINDLHQLSLTDLGSMQYKMEPTDLNEVVVGVIQSMNLSAGKKEITIKHTLSPMNNLVLGDKNRLQQMFINIMNNAISYTDTGGKIIVSVKEDTDGKSHIIQVEDSAPGLLPDEMEQMFDRLYRKETSRNKKLGGSGLGLAITKNIVEAHHGTIKAEPSELGGVKLTVRLPKYV